MRTLIIPCAGKSTRFPNMKPKWLLTHPDGSLVIYKNISALELTKFNRVIFTIVKEHDEKYFANLILKQIFSDKKFEVCILNDFTSGPAETVFKTISSMDIKGPVVVKDSDNLVCFTDEELGDFVVGLQVTDKINVNRISSKSFILLNEQSNVIDIIEKKIKSDIISLGVYGFKSAEEFIEVYKSYLAEIKPNDEVFISHIISYMIGVRRSLFNYSNAKTFEDWGTLDDWLIVQKKHSTYFFDIDGVVLKNTGKHGPKNWDNTLEPLRENVQLIRDLIINGAQIVFVTSRPETYRKNLEFFFDQENITPHALIMGLNHASRIIINDFAPTNPYPSCQAISIPRDSSLGNYLK